MTHLSLPIKLRTLLALDALTCLVMGAALCLSHGALASLLAVPGDFLFWAGVVLFPCALLMLLAAAPAHTPVFLAGIVVIGNAAWVVASVVAALVVLDPNAAGVLFILLQAVAVGAIGWLEYQALPRSRTA